MSLLMKLSNQKDSDAMKKSGGYQPPAQISPMTDQEFSKLRGLIYQQIGVEIKDHKKHLLVNRLSKRLRHLGMTSFSDYLKFVEEDSRGKYEMVEMLDAVTTNKTDFFREPKHYTVLEEKVVPALLRDRGTHDRVIKVWSSACSSGEEPYTLAICLTEMLKGHPGWRFEIMGSDVSETVLRTAASGIYADSKVQPIPHDTLRKYFLRGNGRYKIKPEIAKHVSFRKINLKLDYHRSFSNYDIVFCRNVLIYFDVATQQDIIRKHWHVLRPGGFLFLGHSETLHGGQLPFEYIAPSVYRKPLK